MPKISPHQVYTTKETQEHLKISNSTIKRFLKNKIIRANKIGGQYRILGKEILRILSPAIERKSVKIYQNIKKDLKKKIKNW
jgi:excisionase family DNA binding protein